MKNLKKIISLLIVVAICVGCITTVLATNSMDVTYTATVNNPTLTAGSAQTVQMTVRANKDFPIDAIGMTVVAPAGWTIAAIENAELNFTAGDINKNATVDSVPGQGRVNYATFDAENAMTDLVVTVTYNVPANAAPGTYQVGIKSLFISKDYGNDWERNGEAYTTVQIQAPPPYTYTATADPAELDESDSAQTVVVNVKADRDFPIDAIGMTVVAPEGWVITAIENEELGFTAGDINKNATVDNVPGQGRVNYATPDAENAMTDLVVTITYQVPANAAPGTYDVGIKSLYISKDYGNDWERNTTAMTTVTINHVHKPATGDWESDGTNHWQDCECGDPINEGTCSGGTADCQNKAICTTCGNAWGTEGDHRLSNDYTQSNDQHFKECTVDGCGHTTIPENCSGGTATCLTQATCATCQNLYGGLGEHDLTYHAADPSDCTNEGNVEYWECDLCHDKFADADGQDEINDTLDPADGHNFISRVEDDRYLATEATCRDAATYYYSCTVCGASSQGTADEDTFTSNTLDPDNHVGGTYFDDGYAEDCTNNGKEDNTYCGGCDGLLHEGATIPATGHADATWNQEVPSTCYTNGVKGHYHCDDCGVDVLEKTVQAVPQSANDLQLPLDSDNHPGGAYADGGYAEDCTNNGKEDNTYCDWCDALLNEGATIPATGHADATWNQEIPSTCKTNGVRGHYHCDDCGVDVLEKTVQAVPQSANDLQLPLDENNHEGGTYKQGGYPASCAEPGKEDDTYCESCDGLIEEGGPIPLDDHAWGDWTEITPADCENPGEEERYCDNYDECGGHETRPITELGHAWGDWTEITPADCENPGEEERYCDKYDECGGHETRPITELGHTWGDWTVVTPAGEEDGEEERFCEKYDECGGHETRPIPAIGGGNEGDGPSGEGDGGDNLEGGPGDGCGDVVDVPTGDSNNVVLWSVAGLMAMAGLAYVVLAARRRHAK